MEERRKLRVETQEDIVSQKIAEAQARGDLDNPPFEGKPLHLEETPFAPADWRLAFKLLKDNSFAPEFVQRRRNVERIPADLEKASTAADLRRLATQLA